jgi:hypothetical protein
MEFAIVLQVVFSNRNLDASHPERIHLSNLALMCYYEQLTGLLAASGLQAKFLDFLTTNRCHAADISVYSFILFYLREDEDD